MRARARAYIDSCIRSSGSLSLRRPPQKTRRPPLFAWATIYLSILKFNTYSVPTPIQLMFLDANIKN